MSDFNDSLIQSYKESCKLSAGIFFGTILVSAYVIGRSLNALSDPEDIFIVVQTNQQGEFYGLEFSYLALTFFWPLIISGFGAFYTILVDKKELILEQLNKLNTNFNVSLLSPYDLTATASKNNKGLVKFFSWIPHFSILFHTATLSLLFFKGSNFTADIFVQNNPNMDHGMTELEYFILLFLSIICVVASFIWIRNFPKKFRQ